MARFLLYITLFLMTSTLSGVGLYNDIVETDATFSSILPGDDDSTQKDHGPEDEPAITSATTLVLFQQSATQSQHIRLNTYTSPKYVKPIRGPPSTPNSIA